jgi:hypothetical protein
MANPIIEKYKELMEEATRTEYLKYSKMLESENPIDIALAIKKLSNMETIITGVKEFINHDNGKVRLEALKYCNKNKMIDNLELKQFIYDPEISVRLFALEKVVENDLLSFEEIEKLSKDSNEKVRIRLARLLKMYDYHRLDELFKDETNPVIISIINEGNEKEVILNPYVNEKTKEIIINRFVEQHDTVSIYNLLVPIYDELPNKLKKLVIKHITDLPLEFGKKFYIDQMDKEEDVELIRILITSVLSKYSIEVIRESDIAKIEEIQDPKIVNLKFKIAMLKDDPNHINEARQYVFKEEYDYAIRYLLHFQDYMLVEKIEDMLKSNSLKMKSFAIDVIKKFALKDYADKLYELASDKRNPIPLRKKTVNILRTLKINGYSSKLYDIYKEETDKKFKESIIKYIMKTEPEFLLHI